MVSGTCYGEQDMHDDIKYCRVLECGNQRCKRAARISTISVRDSTNYIHTVIDGVKRFIVCLQNRRCSCGQFQLDELPCPHALATLRHRNESYENYCSPYYTRESLMQTYEIPIDSLLDESKWDVPQQIEEKVVQPPTRKRQPRRPKK
ncbi:uncharacterized protein LOC142171685 [Nicotiana tabacum]|uniref:Uncharacterized protein LOC142171685 n=1 Tax=Nicotiana tabacum TaxID=4097 RepID=A0AC58T2M1_TOBAC